MIDVSASSDVPVEPVQRALEVEDPVWVSDLAAWKVLTERADHLNRNLVQYAASIAAALGISTGSGGVFALAQAVAQKTSEELSAFLTGFIEVVSGVAAAMTLVLLALLISTYRARARTEHDAAEHLKALIAAKPDHFLAEAK